MAPRNAVPLSSILLWRVPVPPTSQYAGAALIQGRNPQALPRLGVLLWQARGGGLGTNNQNLGLREQDKLRPFQ
jgi:hypothetical protein